MLSKQAFILSLLLVFGVGISQSQGLLPCSERDFVAEFPRVNPNHWCIELPIVADSEADRTYTSLLFTSNGNLLATHPYRGQVVALIDSDRDQLPDAEIVLAENLSYPNGIVEQDGIFYILGDGIIYRLEENEIAILVDDLPSGRGFLARGIAVDESFLYIGIPMPCDVCDGDHPFHGTVIQMTLNGENPQVIARGLRYPSALEWYQGGLWVTDIGQDSLDVLTFTDEVNRIDLAQEDVPHFGFPYCVGYDNVPSVTGDFDCADAVAPEITFRSNSTPIGLHHYSDDVFPSVDDHLMIVLLGASNSRYIAGHAITSVSISDAGHTYENIAPVDNATNSLPSRWQAPNGRNIAPFQTEFVNNQAGGIFPHLPYDIAHSPEGWLYFSVQGKGIYVLRPQT